MIPWDDPSLRYARDSARQAKCRLLQSWYRENVLQVEPGEGPGGSPNGAWLPHDAVQQRPNLNFLEDSAIWNVAKDRLDAATGAFEPDRLCRSLLSSQPLCVNLFGMLKLHPDEAASVLNSVLGLGIATLDAITIEHAPALAKQALGDRTAFDAYVEFTTVLGERGFLAIETKFTELFSKDDFSAERRDRYATIAANTRGFSSTPSEAIFNRSTSQQFRNTLLALLHRESGGLDLGIAVVAACADDATADDAVAGVNELLDEQSQVRRISFDSIVDAAEGSEALGSWATQFRTRYLDMGRSKTSHNKRSDALALRLRQEQRSH